MPRLLFRKYLLVPYRTQSLGRQRLQPLLEPALRGEGTHCILGSKTAALLSWDAQPSPQQEGWGVLSLSKGGEHL